MFAANCEILYILYSILKHRGHQSPWLEAVPMKTWMWTSQFLLKSLCLCSVGLPLDYYIRIALHQVSYN